jgi:copper chaperone CopZ
MSVWWAVPAAAAVAAYEMRAIEPPPAPVPTDGPNQVVIYVPAMTCASCPEKVTAALAGIAWIETRSIRADRRTRQVKFTVTDRALFNPDKVKEVIARAGYRRTDLLTGPTER